MVSDRLYSKKNDLTLSEVRGTLAAPGEPPLIARQALHAATLSFTHPNSGLAVKFEAPLPEDFAATLDALRGRNVAPKASVVVSDREEDVDEEV